MFSFVFTLLCLFLLFFSSSSHPQAIRNVFTIPVHWKIAGLSLKSENSSSSYARFLLFQQKESQACNGAATLTILFNPLCLETALSSKPSKNENGLICQRSSSNRGKSVTWFTCDEYLKPSLLAGGKRVPEVKRRQLRWRIYDVKDGVYSAGSTPIHNSIPTGQSKISRWFYSAKLEIVQGILGSE
jgi:hypothetical protein